MAEAPKLDIKMLVLPCVMLLGRYVDYKDASIVEKLQYAFATAAALVLGLYYFIYSKVNGKNDMKKIFVPPKAKPQVPFGLGPAAEPLTAEEFEETTYKDYEIKELKAAAQSVIMSVAITFFMSLKFGVHMSLLMQSIMTPLNAFELPLVKKYILGGDKSNEGGLLYNEQFTKPTTESLALAERVKAAKEAAKESTSCSSITGGPVAEGEPRVEELKDEDSQKEKEKEKEEDKEPKKDK